MCWALQVCSSSLLVLLRSFSWCPQIQVLAQCPAQERLRRAQLLHQVLVVSNRSAAAAVAARWSLAWLLVRHWCLQLQLSLQLPSSSLHGNERAQRVSRQPQTLASFPKRCVLL